VIHRHVIRIKPQLLPGQIQHNLQRRPVPSRHHRRISHLPTGNPGVPSLNSRTVNIRSLSRAAPVTRSLVTLGSVFALPFGCSPVLGNNLAGTGPQLGLGSTRRGVSSTQRELGTISFRLSVIRTRLGSIRRNPRGISFWLGGLRLSVIGRGLSGISFRSGGFSLSVIRRGPGSIQCRVDRIRCDLRSSSYGRGIGLGFGCVRFGSRRFDRRELDGVGVCLVG
jgi:hypothetical protein